MPLVSYATEGTVKNKTFKQDIGVQPELLPSFYVISTGHSINKTMHVSGETFASSYRNLKTNI